MHIQNYTRIFFNIIIHTSHKNLCEIWHYEQEDNKDYLVERDCKAMLKKVCYKEARIGLEREEAKAKGKG